MTKKGFDYEECYLTFNGEVFAIAENKKNAQVIGETLIQLFNENEQLKSEKEDMQILINNISDQRNEFHQAVRENANCVEELKKENEELKKDVRRLHLEVCRRRGY